MELKKNNNIKDMKLIKYSITQSDDSVAASLRHWKQEMEHQKQWRSTVTWIMEEWEAMIQNINIVCKYVSRGEEIWN